MKYKCTKSDVWGILYPALLYMGMMYFVQIVVVFVSSFMIGIVYYEQVGTLSEIELGYIMTTCINSELMFITAVAGFTTIPIGFMFMYMDKIKEKNLGIYEKYKSVSPLKFLLIVPLGVTSMLMGNYFVSFIQAFLPETWLVQYDEAASILYGDGIAVQIVASVIMAPLIEEIIFRGLIYRRIKRVSNSVIAMILSALFFGVFHMNVVQGIYAFIIGLILAYVCERYKTIWAPIIMHAVANGVSVWATSLVPADELQQTQDIVYTQPDLIALLVLSAITGFFTVSLLIAIHNLIKPERIGENNENIY